MNNLRGTHKERFCFVDMVTYQADGRVQTPSGRASNLLLNWPRATVQPMVALDCCVLL